MISRNILRMHKLIARAFLDRCHLMAASGHVPEYAEQAVANARREAAITMAPGWMIVDGTPVPGMATVRDRDLRTRMVLDYRDARYPVITVRSRHGSDLGAIHMSAQVPLMPAEKDWDEKPGGARPATHPGERT